MPLIFLRSSKEPEGLACRDHWDKWCGRGALPPSLQPGGVYPRPPGGGSHVVRAVPPSAGAAGARVNYTSPALASSQGGLTWIKSLISHEVHAPCA